MKSVISTVIANKSDCSSTNRPENADDVLKASFVKISPELRINGIDLTKSHSNPWITGFGPFQLNKYSLLSSGTTYWFVTLTSEKTVWPSNPSGNL